MRRLPLIIPALLLLLASCQGLPPTQIVLVVTATPNAPDTTSQQASTEEIAITEEPSPSPTETPRNAPTSTPAGTPTATPVVNQIQVAEQVFENGRMFWIQPTNQIWIMVVTGEGRGDWSVFEDTFAEGEPEIDPQLEAPAGMEQPRRGFGKLWRENPDIQDALGWAITPEFGYVTRYEYHCREQAAEAGQTGCTLGYHVLTSLYEEAFRFNESDSTWQLN